MTPTGRNNRIIQAPIQRVWTGGTKSPGCTVPVIRDLSLAFW